MKIKYFLVVVLLLLMQNVIAQEPVLYVQGTAANNYIMHKVEPKENWFSIGRLYNVHPKELAIYNKTVVEKGLQIAQIINVPLTVQNKVDVFGSLEEGEATVPLYYIVKKEEGLYRVAVNNNTTKQTIREWNDLTSDSVALGTKLKVGFLKVKVSESAFVNKNISAIPVYANVPTTTEIVTAKTDGPIVINKTPNIETVTKPKQVAIDEPKVVDVPKPLVEKPKQVAIDEPKVVNVPKPIVEKPKQIAIDEPKATENTEVNNTIQLNTEGYFKVKYIQNNKLVNEGKCSIFKSGAGWDDEKYYAIISNVPLGSIVKIENKKTGKIIYAKVLDGLKDFKQNDNIVCMLSAAAAYALGEKEGVFDVVVNN